jgi:FkbM family methyltransferase
MSIRSVLTKSFLFNLFTLARFSHAKKYLLKTLFHKIDPYYAYVLSKDRECSLNIWAIKQMKHRKKHFAEDLYFWELNRELWLGNLDHIHGLYEYLQGSFHDFYRCDCRDKSVLDIGGYIGESALYFLKQGARKIVIYEPVEKNVVCMRHHLKNYAAAVEIIPKGVAQEDGEMTILSNYPAGHIGFGNREGRYQLTTEGESFHSILSHVNVDIAKIDCEGGERYLLSVETPLLRKIPYWIIEFHEAQIAKKIEHKFLSSGFETIPIAVPAGHQSICHFRRVTA